MVLLKIVITKLKQCTVNVGLPSWSKIPEIDHEIFAT
jgi:hypothetical protein